VDECITGFEMTAMWNLNGNDIKKAKDDLESRRATLKSKYEEEMKQIDTELADIEAVERVAVNFVSNRKGGDGSPKSDESGRDEPSAFDSATEMKSSADGEKHSENSPESHDKPAAEQKGSRWRMRLGTVSETEAAD
jgi:hypothetical protein